MSPDVDDVLMIDELTALSALVSSRHTPHATRDMQNVVRRSPLITASQSSSLMLAYIMSRKMPSLFTTTLQSPNASIAMSHTLCAPDILDTSALDATAIPPAWLISSVTACATVGSLPVPSGPEPLSHTTTCAPSFANNNACWRPMPRPAPVMMAIRPSSTPTLTPFPVETLALLRAAVGSFLLGHLSHAPIHVGNERMLFPLELILD